MEPGWWPQWMGDEGWLALNPRVRKKLRGDFSPIFQNAYPPFACMWSSWGMWQREHLQVKGKNRDSGSGNFVGFSECWVRMILCLCSVPQPGLARPDCSAEVGEASLMGVCIVARSGAEWLSRQTLGWDSCSWVLSWLLIKFCDLGHTVSTTLSLVFSPLSWSGWHYWFLGVAVRIKLASVWRVLSSVTDE